MATIRAPITTDLSVRAGCAGALWLLLLLVAACVTGCEGRPGLLAAETGAADAGPTDESLADAGLIVDAGLTDAGLIDAGLIDAGLTDGGDGGGADAGEDLSPGACVDGSSGDSGVTIDGAFVLTAVSGYRQSGISGAALGQPFVVKVHDAEGAPVAGLPVAFTVATGGGTLWEVQGSTDDAGQASAFLVLGPTSGEQRVSVGGSEPTPTLTFCAKASKALLIPAVVGSPHAQDVAFPAPVSIEYSGADGLPDGLMVDPGGTLHGTPLAAGIYEVSLKRTGSDGFADAPRATLLVLPGLTAYERQLLLQLATRPMELASSCAADFGGVARLDAPPTFVFEPEPSFAGTDRYSTQTGLLADGGETDGRRFLERTLSAVVPVLTGDRFTATFADHSPDGGVNIRVAPTRNLGASGDRVTAEVRAAAGRPPDDHLHGNGAIEYGSLWLPEAWFANAPATTWDIDSLNDTLVHELGHVLNGPHTIMPGPGFVQQRLRRDLRPLGANGEPLHPVDQDEALTYRIIYSTPVDASRADLVRAGLLLETDADSAPEIRAISVMVSSGGIFYEDPHAPIHPGSRVAIFGGRFKGPFEDVYCTICPWTTPTITLPTATGPRAVPRIATQWVGDPDQHLEVVVPADGVSGDVVVETTHPLGCTRASAPFPLVVVP